MAGVLNYEGEGARNLDRESVEGERKCHLGLSKERKNWKNYGRCV